MWKIPVFTMILATMLLGGCNWGNDNANQETPMEDVGNDIKNGVNDVGEDIQKGVNDVEDAVTPDHNNDVYDRDVNGVDNNGTVNDNGVNNNGTVNDNGVAPETNPNTNLDVNRTNENVNGTVKEGAIEEKVEIRDRENINTR